ncbi:MAG TPA: DUF4286 family protein [Dehalococcoidia bacterium]|nr:DUF4286 family protein [Dehalococcoidia bacterium]
MAASNRPALMFVATDVDPQYEQAWNRWYDTRHVPQRQGLPGFQSARRFEVLQGTETSRKYLALYDLEGPEALETEAYLSLSREPIQNAEDREMLTHFRNRLRGIMSQISDTAAPGSPSRANPGALLVVGLEPDAAHEEEFNAWYEQEHIPFLTSVPGVLGVRRFKRIRDDLPYLAIWELMNAEIRQSEAWRKAAGTPWTARVVSHCKRWITGTYRPLVPATATTPSLSSAS